MQQIKALKPYRRIVVIDALSNAMSIYHDGEQIVLNGKGYKNLVAKTDEVCRLALLHIGAISLRTYVKSILASYHMDGTEDSSDKSKISFESRELDGSIQILDDSKLSISIHNKDKSVSETRSCIDFWHLSEIMYSMAVNILLNK